MPCAPSRLVPSAAAPAAIPATRPNSRRVKAILLSPIVHTVGCSLRTLSSPDHGNPPGAAQAPLAHLTAVLMISQHRSAPPQALGIDFGTTNSSLALASAGTPAHVQLARYPTRAAGSTPSFRSILFFAQHG